MWNVISLFSGIGGMDLAVERAGFNVVAQIENDDKCQSVLRRHFPRARIFTDATKFHARFVANENIRIAIGGFPCQDLSVAGARKGLAGPRSQLWYEYARYLTDARPEWCIIENVDGLLSSSGGRDLGIILGTLGHLGYGFAYRVLDAQWFGVPQRRKRIFIVGHLGDALGPAEILLEPESGPGDIETFQRARPDIAPTLTARTRGGGFPGTDDAANGYVIPAQTGTGQRVDDIDVTRSGLGGGGPDDNLAQAGHLVPVAFHVTQDPISGAISPALSTGNRSGCATIGDADGVGVRKLMPIECERLQGFPDNWTAGQPDTTRYRQLGNAAPVPVVHWIACRLADRIELVA